MSDIEVTVWEQSDVRYANNSHLAKQFCSLLRCDVSTYFSWSNLSCKLVFVF